MNIFKYSLALTLLTGGVLYADLEDPTYSAESITQNNEDSPYTIEANSNLVGRSKFKNSDIKDQYLNFHLVDVDLSMVFYYDESIKEGAFAEIGYTSTYLNWKQNPFFRQSCFNTIDLSLGGFTERLCDWHWLGEATVHVDPIKDFTFADYTYYDLLLWGRYAYCENIGLNIGLIVQTGMKIDRLYPIIGVDWQINSKWKINAVFPVNVSAIYSIDKCWSVSLAARTFDVRHRVKKSEPYSRGLFTYRNVGGEFVLKYDSDSRVIASVHAGYTTGGMFKVANRHYENKRHFKFEGAPYGGADILVKF